MKQFRSEFAPDQLAENSSCQRREVGNDIALIYAVPSFTSTKSPPRKSGTTCGSIASSATDCQCSVGICGCQKHRRAWPTSKVSGHNWLKERGQSEHVQRGLNKIRRFCPFWRATAATVFTGFDCCGSPLPALWSWQMIVSPLSAVAMQTVPNVTKRKSP